jgi:lysophospholipase L1-like esterase
LAKRLLARPGNSRLAILNAGIGGNRLLSDSTNNFGINALARFDRDVLAQPGAAYVIVLEGINDIGNARSNPSPSAAELISAQEQLIERAHAHGLRIYGATLTPFEGAAYFTPEGEAKRLAINNWIKNSKAYDGVIDFDFVTRDPASPGKFLPLYDSGDHLHPNDAGYEAMGKAIDLNLFAPGKKRH